MMEKTVTSGKPTFQHIRQRAKTREGKPITRQDIINLTGLTSAEVYVIDIGGYSSREGMLTVLQVFNQLTGQNLTLDEVRRGGAKP